MHGDVRWYASNGKCVCGYMRVRVYVCMYVGGKWASRSSAKAGAICVLGTVDTGAGIHMQWVVTLSSHIQIYVERSE